MALPESRNTTYAPGSQVKSDDLNAIQDGIVAGSHGSRVRLISPHSLAPISTATLGGSHLLEFDVGEVAYLPLEFDVGDVLDSVSVVVANNIDEAGMELRVRKRDPAAGDLGSITTLGSVGGFTDEGAMLVDELDELIGGAYYWIEIQRAGAGGNPVHTGLIQAAYKRPLPP